MANFTKNAVRILPKIYNSENKVVIYTEFDGFFEVGDKLYIMVNNIGVNFSQEYYKLDSYYNRGNENSSIGYTLLEKDNNLLKLDINYDELGLTNLIEDCYIGRVYIKDSIIENSTINGVSFHNVNFNINSKLNLIWKQGIIFKVSGDSISNIDFKDKYDSNFLILKSEIIGNNVESFYTYNNYKIGLSYININGNLISLNNCNIYSGTYESCIIKGTDVYINGGKLIECIIGNIDDNITVNGSYLYNCNCTYNVLSKLKWLNGKWYYDLPIAVDNPFNFIEWVDGVWEYGIFPQKVWYNGRFINGTFNGLIWYNGIFNNGIFNYSIWNNGYFNGGTIIDSDWNNGVFNNGSIDNNSTWSNGIFNNGEFKNSIWVNGIFNGGIISNCIWSGGTFNNGKITDFTIWYNGIFKNGIFDDNSIWNNGVFHNGTFNKSIWNNGKFYNGSIFDSEWHNGEMFFGTVINLKWSDGTWHNGIANLIDFYAGDWEDGIFNSGRFYGSATWYNGSFNNGYFGTIDSPIKPNWINGIFYNGEFNGKWIRGTFYISSNPDANIPAKDYIGKEFVPYNKDGIIIKPNPITREPKSTNNSTSTTVKDAVVSSPRPTDKNEITVTETVINKDGSVSTITKKK